MKISMDIVFLLNPHFFKPTKPFGGLQWKSATFPSYSSIVLHPRTSSCAFRSDLASSFQFASCQCR